MLVKRRQNGYGLRYGVCFDTTPQAYEPWFDDHAKYIADAFRDGAVVLSGEPGAGKSHITEDAVFGSYAMGKAVCMVSCHINAWSRAGRDATQEVFDTAGSLGSDCLVVIDNLDYLVYTGAIKRRRTNASTREYAAFITRNVTQLQDEGCAIFATVHSAAWRQNHSRAPQDVWNQYETLVAGLGGETVFTGSVTLENAERLLQLRGIDSSTSVAIAGELEQADALYFRQAHHLSVDTWQSQGIMAATAEVDAFKNQKIAGGA